MNAPLAARLRTTAASTGMAYLEGHEPSLWLRGQISDVVTGVRTRQVSTCGHLTSTRPGIVALWARDRVVCEDCAPELRLTGDADNTCDRCAVVVDKGTTIHAHVMAPLPCLLLVYGLCPACHRREVPQ